MKSEKKSFRIEISNLEFLHTIKEKMNFKSLSESVNFVLAFIGNKEKNLSANLNISQELIKNKTQEHEAQEKEIRIFVTKTELEILKNLARQNGFSTANKMAKLILINHLYDKPLLTNEAINEFAKTNALIKRVGINLNQFLKAIHQDSSAYFAKNAIENLILQIENQVKEISNFIQKQKEILRVKLR